MGVKHLKTKSLDVGMQQIWASRFFHPSTLRRHQINNGTGSFISPRAADFLRHSADPRTRYIAADYADGNVVCVWREIKDSGFAESRKNQLWPFPRVPAESAGG